MSGTLIVSSGLKGQETLSTLLKANDIQPLTIAKSANEVRRMLIEQEFETIIILTPLTDEFGVELAIHISEQSSSGIIMIVKQELADQVRAKVEDFGIFVVETPISRVVFYQALRMLSVARRRMVRLEKENTKLKYKIIDMKTVDRAKCALIQYLNMSENQAHHYIEKQAMNRQLTRKEVAESILRTYEN